MTRIEIVTALVAAQAQREGYGIMYMDEQHVSKAGALADLIRDMDAENTALETGADNETE